MIRFRIEMGRAYTSAVRTLSVFLCAVFVSLILAYIKSAVERTTKPLNDKMINVARIKRMSFFISLKAGGAGR